MKQFIRFGLVSIALSLSAIQVHAAHEEPTPAVETPVDSAPAAAPMSAEEATPATETSMTPASEADSKN